MCISDKPRESPIRVRPFVVESGKETGSECEWALDRACPRTRAPRLLLENFTLVQRLDQKLAYLALNIPRFFSAQT